MAITVGTQLGYHEITELLGKGGMGEVYRARDTKLKREVAIKILPDEFSRDTARVSRFQREAELLASLNHPNIAAIYDLQEAGETRFLVLELVEGETLAERIQRGPIPIEEALQIAGSICEALEAAHEKGVVHRDLKPANVKVTSEGRVKVLDFGLAKAISGANASAIATPVPGTLSNSPTMLTIGATQAGVILGTVAYMSPEQAKGLDVDVRSDTFSFGSLVYEMLSGRQPFHGDTAAEVLASVLVREPDFSLLPPNLNPRIQELLQRCFQKSPKRRWQAVGDLRAELDTVAKTPLVAPVHDEARENRRPVSRRLLIPVLLSSIVFAGIASIATWNLKRPSPGAVVRLPFILPDGQQLTSGGSRQLAVSPDGTRLVYVANGQLFLRAMEDMEARPIAGTNNQIPSSPFFSPDGQWIGFYSRQDNAFKKVPIRGGAALTIFKDNGFNASWTGEQIVYGNTNKGIMRVSENGGNPEVLASIKPSELADNPQILDDGRFLLFSLATEAGPDRFEKAQIVMQSLKTGERKVVLQGANSARYLPTGHLAFVQGATLFVIPFDLKTLRVHGSAAPLIEGVGRTNLAVSGVANYVLSDNGSLFYIPGGQSADRSVLALVDAGSGKIAPLPLPPQLYYHPRISPNGEEIVFATFDNSSSIISIYDLKAGGSARRLTFEGNNGSPIWSRDGRHITYRSTGPADSGIFWQPSDGGAAERLTKEDGANIQHLPDAWARDGKTLAFTVLNKGVGDIWTLSIDGEQKSKPIIESPFSQRDAVFSSDGRWLAYASSELANRSQIFVQPFPPTDQKYQISTEGGAAPLWSPDGKYLYYQEESRLAAVEIHTAPAFGFGKPVALPVQRYQNTVSPTGRNYDITPDGKQFVVVMPASSTADQTSRPTQQINVVLNWFSELQQRVPAK